MASPQPSAKPPASSAAPTARISSRPGRRPASRATVPWKRRKNQTVASRYAIAVAVTTPPAPKAMPRAIVSATLQAISTAPNRASSDGLPSARRYAIGVPVSRLSPDAKTSAPPNQTAWSYPSPSQPVMSG